MSDTDPLAERALEVAVDGHLTFATLMANLMIKLVEKHALTSRDVREVMGRSAGIIRYAAPDAVSRQIYLHACEQLAQRFEWPAGVCELPVDPLPPDEDP